MYLMLQHMIELIALLWVLGISVSVTWRYILIPDYEVGNNILFILLVLLFGFIALGRER